MHRVYLINFHYFLDGEWHDLEDAIARGKKAGFEFSVVRQGGQGERTWDDVVVSWSPIGGLTRHE